MILYAHIKKEQIPKVEALFRVLKFSVSGLGLDNIKFTEIEDKTLLSFSFNDKYHDLVIERFALNNIDIVPPDGESKKIIESAHKKLKKKDSVFSGFAAAPKKKKPLPDLIKEGNYQEIFNIVRDVTQEKSKLREAREGLDKAIANAITIAYKTGKQDSMQLERQLDKLIDIASDRNLQAFQKKDFLKEAGSLAINLAASDSKYYKKLLNLTNNRNVLSEIAVTAAAKFSQLMLSEKYPNSKLVDFALKNVNEKFLDTQYVSSKKTLSSKIVNDYKTLIDFLKKERKKRQ